MFDELTISDEEISRLLTRSEGQYLDFKSSRSNKQTFKSVSSFANADGGDLYVGIGDEKEADRLAHAFANAEAANGLATEVLGMFQHGPEFVGARFIRVSPDRLVLWLTIQKAPFLVRTPSGEVFKRLNASDQRIDGSALSKLELDKGIVSAEDQKTDVAPDDVLDAKIGAFFRQNLVPEMDMGAFLAQEKLIVDGRLRLGGVLIFSDYPQPDCPQAAVKIYRYKSSSSEGERENLVGHPETIEGPIYTQIERAVNTTRRIIESIPILSISGLREIRYPPEAIHEVVCNAILHRDYSINDYVHIRIFENRVEVESPGKLAGHITLENLLRQRFARNKKTVRIINKFPNPPNKDVGEGLNTAFRAMQQLNLRRPEIVETSASVLVRLAHEPLASREEIIKNYLEKHETINNTRARQICNVPSDSVVRKMFSQMRTAGEIEVVPGTRAKGTKYRLKKRPDQR